MSIKAPKIRNIRQLQLPYKILELLKCCECNGFLSTPPIMNRSKKGALCGNCVKSHVDKGSIRNTQYETLARFTEFPCNNRGCSKSISFGQMSEHDNSCPFKLSYECPFPTDKWSGNHSDFNEHLSDMHKDKIITNNMFEINLSSSDTEMQISLVEDHYYVVKTSCNVSANLIYNVEFLGTYPKVLKHKYYLEFIGDKATRPFKTEEMDIVSPNGYDKKPYRGVIEMSTLFKNLRSPTSIRCIVYILNNDIARETNIDTKPNLNETK